MEDCPGRKNHVEPSNLYGIKSFVENSQIVEVAGFGEFLEIL